MMFRKPMRLEKWIAFDGALGVDVVEQVLAMDADSAFDPGDDGSGESGLAILDESQTAGDQDSAAALFLDVLSPFIPENPSNTVIGEFDNENDPDNSHEYEVTLPYAPPAHTGGPGDPYLPFYTDGNVEFNESLADDAYKLYFEVNNPKNGSFDFLDTVDVENQSLPGFNEGDYLVAKGTGYHRYLYLYRYESGMFKLVDSVPGGRGGVGNYTIATDDQGNPTSVIFTLFNSADLQTTTNPIDPADPNTFLSSDQLAGIMFRSLQYKPEHASRGIGSFDVNIYYDETAAIHNGTIVDPDPNTPPWDTATDDDNRVGRIEDASRRCDRFGRVILDRVPLPPIVNPPSLDSGDSGDSGDDSGDSGDAGEASGDGGDSGGDVAYIHYQEAEDGEDDSDEPEPIRRERAEAESPGRDGDTVTMETAAEAATLELLADLEFLLDSVHEDREALAEVLDLLRDEYLARDSDEWGDARDALRELFEAGNGEMNAINRVIAELNRQMDDFHAFAAPRRDGMLLESLRELASSVARRGGETGAITQALSAVARLLTSARGGEGDAPDATTLRAAFTETYEREMAEWLIRAERLDPMGQELSAAQRNLEK